MNQTCTKPCKIITHYKVYKVNYCTFSVENINTLVFTFSKTFPAAVLFQYYGLQTYQHS